MPTKLQIYALTHLQIKMMIIWWETVNNMTLRHFTILLWRCKCKMSGILLTFLHLNQKHSVPCKIPELKCPLHSLCMLPPPPLPPPLPPPPPLLLLLQALQLQRSLAFSTSIFHLVRILMQSFQFVIFILVISLFISSSHLFLGLPSDRVSASDCSYTSFTMLLSGIRCTCLNQANLCALMSATTTTTTTTICLTEIQGDF